MIGYRLNEEFLNKNLKEYQGLGDVDFSFQEYIESMYAPTVYSKDYFLKNNLPYIDDLHDKISRDRKYEISDFGIRKSYDKFK